MDSGDMLSDSLESSSKPSRAERKKVDRTPQWIKQGLHRKKFSGEACHLALRGEKVPEALGLAVTRLCVIRGIRLHHGFAKELRGSISEFTRALNARAIMSNDIPEMSNAEDFPYCIWYPDVAREDTYRQLAKHYPSMRYLVGRACAVAGYSDLYSELDLLPEVHIAEEARDNGQISIHDSIMANEVKYSCMDDYERTTDPEEPKVAHLNGDTAVRSLLCIRQPFTKPLNSWNDGFTSRYLYFNICEDLEIDDNSDPHLGPSYLDSIEQPQDHIVELLSSPLPPDLPTVHKDLLILMAAYNGEVDRYARLKRPSTIEDEFICMIRGIYHSQSFADWCVQQDLLQKPNWYVDSGLSSSWRMPTAIVARCIMSNDLSCIDAGTHPVPYQIWYPDVAEAETYVRLAQHRPDMRLQCARACIVGNYQAAFDSIDPEPDYYLLCEAQYSPNPYFAQSIVRKADEVGNDAPLRIRGDGADQYHLWKEIPIEHYTSERRDINDDGSLTVGPWSIRTGGVADDMQRPIYDGVDVDVSRIERAIKAHLQSCGPR